MKLFTALFFLLASFIVSAKGISIAYDTGKDPVSYAVNKLCPVLIGQGTSVATYSVNNLAALPNIGVVIRGPIPKIFSPYLKAQHFDGLQAEGYKFTRINNGKNLLILSADEVGAMYGLLDLTESIRVNGSFNIPDDKEVAPSLGYRIIKFNLPWSPYRKSPATEVHISVCRDLKFWERFLDMMAANRWNVLSLWNNHPFPYMIRSNSFPKATPFDDDQMKEWQQFWTSLFRMAKARGIQTFIVNWNIVVSPEFAKAYGAQEYNDLSEQVKRYTRESVTQVINEYPDLTGIGVTLADWMGTFNEKMTPQQREDWIEDTFIAGIKAANRPVKFLHRSVLAGDPMAMRNLLDKANLSEPALVEIKFNWSHGHSTPHLAITHDYHSGRLDERFWSPPPTNYKIQWMIRNEDFFILRWGQPDFIRQHIATNSKEYVNGYFVGSEGYIPAQDYSQRPSASKTWQYAFEKQWLFYMMWGRLLYQINTPDDVFSSAFDLRYGKGVGDALLKAYKLCSKMPLRLASFHRSTWDYTLYAEGFLEAEPSSPDGFFDRSSPFISILEFINHETLDPGMLSIPSYVEHLLSKNDIASGLVTPIMLADSSEADSRKVLAILHSLEKKVNEYSGALSSELDDAITWSYLGLYFADKLRAGVALEIYRKTGDANKKQDAINFLHHCVEYWDKVIEYTKDRYMPVPHVSTQHYGNEFKEFAWYLFRDQVIRDVELASETVFK
ncbi:MAG TPA: hypothetical protein VFW11_04310 [Cyclobacteriaceae bacterium]|nr:hypothetical protein [Cyclobacteriaceae bacterium]